VSIDQETAVGLLLEKRAMLLGYLSSIVRDFALAEDLFQEIAIIVMRKHAELGRAEEFGVWARKIARFQALNALRKRDRGPQPIGDNLIDLLDAQWAASESSRPSEQVERLRHCLNTLTERSRKLVRMRYHDGISSGQIAEQLRKPLNTIYVALSRIHRSLAVCMQRQAPASEGGPLDG